MCVERFIELVLTTQRPQNVHFLELAAPFDENKTLDADPIEIRCAANLRFGRVLGAKSWEMKKIKKKCKGADSKNLPNP